jgi:hypothetical protein
LLSNDYPVVYKVELERDSAFWMAEAARTQTFAKTMKNPLAKKGMESIAACYEGFARRARVLARSEGAAERQSHRIDELV